MNNYIENIKHNIETLNRLRVQIPEFDAHLTGVKENDDLIWTMRLGEFLSLFKYLQDKSDDTIYLRDIPSTTWKQLKPIILENCRSEFKKTLATKSEKQFQHTMQSRQSVRKYSSLWYNTTIKKALQGYVLANTIKFDNDIKLIDKWYLNKITVSDYIYTKKEIDATDSLISRITDQINGEEISRINVSQFTNKIREAIEKKITSIISVGCKLKCKDIPGDGLLTPGNIYTTIATYINGDGYLYVTVINDSNIQKQYMYTVFEELSKERNSQLDDLLSTFQ